MKRALIVTGGTTDTGFGRRYIAENGFDWMIAADLGLNFFYKAKINPDWAIGDFDSVDGGVLKYFESQEGLGITRLIPEKDDTDTEAAVRLAIAEGCGEIHILGATGSRLDHMLGNVGLLGIGLLEGVELFLADPQNRARMINREVTITKQGQYGNFVSLLAVTPEVTGVTLCGMKYPLKDYTMNCFSSLGISNEIVEDEARICLRDGVLLVVEAKDGA
jgi:thiamine pyrophosphokinase